jgi:hypothetical protein
MKRTVAGKENGGVFFFIKAFQSVTKCTIRLIAMLPKSTVSEINPPVAMKTNLSGSAMRLSDSNDTYSTEVRYKLWRYKHMREPANPVVLGAPGK